MGFGPLESCNNNHISRLIHLTPIKTKVKKNTLITSFSVLLKYILRQLKVLNVNYEIKQKSYPELHQMVQFEGFYADGFPDTLTCNSEMWVGTQCKQSTWL